MTYTAVSSVSSKSFGMSSPLPGPRPGGPAARCTPLRPALTQKVVSRVVAQRRLLELLQGSSRVVTGLGWHLDIDLAQEVAWRAVGPAEALAADPERAAVGRHRRV